MPLPARVCSIVSLADVKFGSYRLACDIGAAPSATQVLSFGIKTFLTWALGPNFNTKFRLVGPWTWDGAAAVMEGELWTVIRRRKGFNGMLESESLTGWIPYRETLANQHLLLVWLSMSIMPILLFGVLNLLYYAFYVVKDALAPDWSLEGRKRSSGSAIVLRGIDPQGTKRAQAVRDACIAEE